MGKDDEAVNLTKHMFEFLMKDEFLPIYTHNSYTKIFKDTSITMELSPNKRRSVGKNSTMSPFRQDRSTISQRSSQIASPSTTSVNLRSSHVLDMHKKTGIEMRQSPSKGSKIVMRYINCYADVGPQLKQKEITYTDLIDMAKNIDKKDLWVRSDLRIIFACNDP